VCTCWVQTGKYPRFKRKSRWQASDVQQSTYPTDTALRKPLAARCRRKDPVHHSTLRLYTATRSDATNCGDCASSCKRPALGSTVGRRPQAIDQIRFSGPSIPGRPRELYYILVQHGLFMNGDTRLATAFGDGATSGGIVIHEAPADGRRRNACRTSSCP